MPYAFHNHPRGAYYLENKGMLIKDLVRASCAAPSYFTSKELTLSNKPAVFIDGGVSSNNNPSLMLFMIATLKGYPFQWKKGNDNLFLTSIGTGTHRPKMESGIEKLVQKMTIKWAKEVPDLFMMDATILNQMILQSISDPDQPTKINDEAGTLENDRIIDEPLLSYRRYNILIEKNELQSLGYQFDDAKLTSLREMSNGFNVRLLNEIGKRAATLTVKAAHFLPAFDQGLSFSIPLVVEQQDCKNLFLLWINTLGNTYEKFGTVEARLANHEEQITSITKYGVETTSRAAIGDYIVTNTNTESGESYIIKHNKFDTRYQFIRRISDEKALYKPIGMVKAVQLTKDILKRLNLPDHFTIMPAWNEPQYISKGDYIVCPPDESEFYRIGYDEFINTYKLEN
ncbi:MAG: hypothetical protein IPP42_07415 [Saprospiraceae bacterium]|nr:hypothetical protein [Saprospiraceae bacterium]